MLELAYIGHVDRTYEVAYRKGHVVPPELLAWRDARIAAGGGPEAARTAMRKVSAIAHGLGVPPRDLPDNALELYVKQTPLSPATLGHYEWCFKQWRRFLRDGHRSRERVPMTPGITDPDLERWEIKLKSDQRAHRTIRDYLKILQACADLGQCAARDIDEEDVRRFIVNRQDAQESIGKHLSASRRNVYLAAIRSFCKAMRLPDATEWIERSRRIIKGTPPVSREQVKKLREAGTKDMSSSDPVTSDKGRRMTMLTKLMCSMGLRISTACVVQPVDDIHFDGESWWLDLSFLKGHQGHPMAAHRVPEDIVSDALTNWQRGESVVSTDRAAQSHGQDWQGWAISHGVTNVRPHMCRAYFARRLFRQAGDAYTVQKALDHQQLSTTQAYLGDEELPDVPRILSSFDVDLNDAIPAQRPSMENVVLLRGRSGDTA